MDGTSRRIFGALVASFFSLAAVPGFAHVTELVVVDATDSGAQALGLSVCEIYAQFDDDIDVLISVGHSNIITDDPNGFYQHLMNFQNTSPACSLLPLFPELAYDSFVTVGTECNDGTDATTLDPDFDSNLFNNGGGVAGGWYNINSANGQGEQDENGRVFLGRFTATVNSNIYGNLRVYYDVGIVLNKRLFFTCHCPSPPAADLNDDGLVNSLDLATLLNAWGPNPGHPADLDGDGTVGASDLAILLGSWGPCLQ